MKKMKRWMRAGICAAIAASVCLAGCSGQEEESTAESSAAQTEEYVAESTITLGEYKGIPVTVEAAQVTDEEVEAQIQQLLNASAEYVEVDRAAQLGDQVNIDYTGYLDGEPFEGGSDTGFDLELGSGRFIDGFEDGLVGAKAGESRSLDLTFPEEYSANPDLEGQPVVFEVTVHAVKERSVPELTDAFIAEISPEAGTVEQYREDVRKALLDQKELLINNQRDADILNAIVANSEITCSTEAIDDAFDTQIQAYTNMAAMYGMDLATYAGLMGMDEESLRAELRVIAEDMAKQELVLDEVAKLEQIEVEDADRESLAQEFGYDSVDAMLENDGVTEELIDETALMRKTMEFLVENAQITVEEEAAASAE